MSSLSLLLLVAGCRLAVPGAVLCDKVAAALLHPRKARSESAPPAARPRLAVVAPAHDEERSLPGTLGSVREQLRPLGATLEAWISERGTVAPSRPAALLSDLAASLALSPRLLSLGPRCRVRSKRSETP